MSTQINWKPKKSFHRFFLFILAILASLNLQANAQDKLDYPLGSGDSIRVQVFQNPDLTIETRLSENGSITYPLIGSVDLRGLSVATAEKKIADALQQGGFIQQPQVNISMLQMRGNLVSVFGNVNRPGRFPIETANMRVTDMLANAGGANINADDTVVLTGIRDEKPFRRVINIADIFLDEKMDDNLVMQGGDTIYVHRAAVFYIYGEAQRPGAFRVERSMTIMQALAQGGGPTTRGSEKRLRLHRQRANGSIEQIEPKLTDPVLPNDVIYVKESLF